MCLADQEASKHLFECKVYSQKFWDVKIWDLNRPLLKPIQESSEVVKRSLSIKFTSTQKTKIFQGFPSYWIFRRMHEVLNIDKNKN